MYTRYLSAVLLSALVAAVPHPNAAASISEREITNYFVTSFWVTTPLYEAYIRGQSAPLRRFPVHVSFDVPFEGTHNVRILGTDLLDGRTSCVGLACSVSTKVSLTEPGPNPPSTPDSIGTGFQLNTEKKILERMPGKCYIPDPAAPGQPKEFGESDPASIGTACEGYRVISFGEIDGVYAELDRTPAPTLPNPAR
ncbi:MAG: hypothetical protein M1833_005191 [Piccolia ochrophora]|nr:MAG: hypothetical protein M1833_005191 [Piccolia ochrophora]